MRVVPLALYPLKRLIRFAVPAVAVLNLTSCSHGELAEIDTIQIHRFGPISYDVIVHANGKGEFEGGRAVLEKGKRTFALKPGQFGQLASSIEPYRHLAKPVTDGSIRDVVDGKWPKCPANSPDEADAGSLYLHWLGPKTNVHYVVDLGCHETGNYEQNQSLLVAVYRLPIDDLVGPFA